MSAQEIPEWFKKICADAYKDNLFLADVFDHIFLEISKPENAAKICLKCKEENEKNSEE